MSQYAEERWAAQERERRARMLRTFGGDTGEDTCGYGIFGEDERWIGAYFGWDPPNACPDPSTPGTETE